MNLGENLESLFANGILALQPSEQLIAANTAFETAMSAAPNPMHCETLKTPEEWQAFRATMADASTSAEFLPEHFRPWAEKGSQLAENITIPGPAGDLEVRLLKPQGGIKGALLHTHGGGFIMGEPSWCDHSHAMAAELCGLLVAAPNYRKAPQAPYPAAQDDCEAAALWLIDYARQQGINTIFIRGESAGGQLAIATAIRMKHKHGFRFDGLVSEVPQADFSNGLPSAKDGFLTDPEALRQTSEAYIPDVEKHKEPDASPLYYSNAELVDLPPAYFACGERDGLRDSALLMFMRWIQAGNNAYILIMNGVGHNLCGANAPEFELAQMAPIEFFNRCLAGKIV